MQHWGNQHHCGHSCGELPKCGRLEQMQDMLKVTELAQPSHAYILNTKHRRGSDGPEHRRDATCLLQKETLQQCLRRPTPEFGYRNAYIYTRQGVF